MPSVVKKGKEWKGSEGKELLIKDLREGRIPVVGSRGDAAAIYRSRVEFGGDDEDEQRKFPERLRRARLAFSQNITRAAFDSEALVHD